MIHYIYKIHFLCGFPTGRYYLGKRTYHGDDLSKDSYTGSGEFCKEYFNEYGELLGKTYIKEILEINPSKKINADREEAIIGDLGKTDPLCMNRCPGGFFGMTDIDRSKPVNQYSTDGTFMKTWPSALEAGLELNIKPGSITSVCRHTNKKRHTAGGFVGCYYNEKPIMNKTVPFKGKRKVKQYTKDSHQFIKEFESLKDAATEMNGNGQHIQKCCNDLKPSAYGYWGRFSD